MCNQTTAKNIQATIINPMIQKLQDNQVGDLIREEPMKIPDASAAQKQEKATTITKIILLYSHMAHRTYYPEKL